ncbi:MAG TPA: methyltransferase domain-containing protein [Acidisoma sp.]|jgi:2-polyprenyl-3-methyl-5-hydroxy-6-metoxy-1,4-benzoquinol methylase|nr:methyltransferase domain-containing protein [Acidisoma sp.]
MNLKVRSIAPELMDAPDLDEATYARCLKDLAAVNRVTATHAASLGWLRRATAGLPPGARFSVLDIAYGQGDLLRAVAGWAARAGYAVELTGIDLNPRSAVAAQAATPSDAPITYLTGDIFEYEPAEPFDFILTSQFTHHLPDEDVLRLIGWMEAHAARGWHIADLHRHWFAYYGFRWLARLFGWHPIVRYDGTVSIARSFRRAEWQALLDAAGVAADLRWHWLFRYGIGRLKT